MVLFPIKYTCFVECPEEVIDNRSLYDKLQEQKLKKDEEYEEQHKLSKNSFLLQNFKLNVT
jgi:hypothetical protein